MCGGGDNICIFIVMFSIELKALDHLIISCSPDYGLHCQWMYLIMSWLIFDSTSVCWYCEILFNVVMQIIVSYMKECTKLFVALFFVTTRSYTSWHHPLPKTKLNPCKMYYFERLTAASTIHLVFLKWSEYWTCYLNF